MKKNRVKLVLAATFTVSSALFLFSAAALANNISVVVRWWKVFLAAGGDSSSVSAGVSGFIPWLDWAAVDHSAVTTFIPALGFLCMSISSLKLLRGKRLRIDEFPFFHGCEQLNVALGLFGTLWGIIVIGYFKLDTVQMADLMQCLHTALFSTLMAVVWVFMVDRPLIRPFFAGLLERSGLAETDDGDLAAAVDRLVVRLGDASDAFDARQREYEAAFEKRAAAYSAHFEKRMADYERQFDARQKEYEQFFSRRIAELEKRAAESESRLKSVAAALHS